jgi:hypothetical protein
MGVKIFGLFRRLSSASSPGDSACFLDAPQEKSKKVQKNANITGKILFFKGIF